jgi:hypothetical protein
VSVSAPGRSRRGERLGIASNVRRRLAERISSLDGRLGSRRWTIALAILAAGFALVIATPGAVTHFSPDSDGLFYEVQKLEVEGHGSSEATRQVFSSPLAHEIAALEDHDVRRVLDPAWVDYSSQFYRRRWFVPAVAAAIDPVVGHDTGVALRVASLIGYVLLAPLLFLLLRRRFSPVVSVGVTALALLAPPVYRSATGMMVDSWGLALEVLAILSVVIIKERGRRWIALWILTLLALSITRDAGTIVILGVLCLTLVERRDVEKLRTNLLVLGTGIAASLPAFLLGGAPVRRNLAYIMNDYMIPPDDSWSYVAAHYPSLLRYTIETDLKYPLQYNPAVTAILYGFVALALLGIIVVIVRPSRGDFYGILAKALIPGCVLLLLIANNPQSYRLELVFLPVSAIGLAFLANWLLFGTAIFRSRTPPAPH